MTLAAMVVVVAVVEAAALHAVVAVAAAAAEWHFEEAQTLEAAPSVPKRPFWLCAHA